jgi:hypothetical protein
MGKLYSYHRIMEYTNLLSNTILDWYIVTGSALS